MPGLPPSHSPSSTRPHTQHNLTPSRVQVPGASPCSATARLPARVQVLNILGRMHLDTEGLRRTKLGQTVGKLRGAASGTGPDVRAAAEALVVAWKKVVEEEAGAGGGGTAQKRWGHGSLSGRRKHSLLLHMMHAGTQHSPSHGAHRPCQRDSGRGWCRGRRRAW